MERRYGTLISSSKKRMFDVHFGMPFVTRFYGIVWKLVKKIVEEAHIHFYRDRVMDFDTLLRVSSITPAFRTYKQEQPPFVV